VRILVVLAHPDDESFICGGTLAHYGARGAQVTLVCATKGEMGRRIGIPPTATRESLPAIREQELREACEALGIQDLRFLGLRDKTLDYYDPADLAARLKPLFAELKPDVVITFHERWGGHPDHCAIGRATTLAHQEEGDGSRLYYCYWGKPEPDRGPYVAITLDRKALRAKLAAWRAHRTQSQTMDWLRNEKVALRKLAETEYFLQGSGSALPGKTELI
jgi:bacillithiol biosynthesis deacetylase BshB2